MPKIKLKVVNYDDLMKNFIVNFQYRWRYLMYIIMFDRILNIFFFFIFLCILQFFLHLNLISNYYMDSIGMILI